MSKIRIYELAKELGVNTKDFMDLLEEKFGLQVKNHMSSIDDETVKAVKDLYAEMNKSPETIVKQEPEMIDKVSEREEKPVENRVVEEIKRNEPAPKKEEENIAEIKLSPSELKLNLLCEKLNKPQTDIIKAMFMKGKILKPGQDLSIEIAETIAMQYNYILTMVAESESKHHGEVVDVNPEQELQEKWKRIYSEKKNALKERSPVVTVMGHVDHGKTTLLDKIRNTKVAEKEAGGITQSIGAYQVAYKDKKITFIDTPGHEAFTEMRARGAQSTDIVVLIIAADDGVMPQTIEAFSHAKDANVPIIVAINKIDKPNANIELTKQQMTSKLNLIPEDWGGDTITVPISAKSNIGIDELLDMIILVSEMQEIICYPKGLARAVIIESKLDKFFGPVATVIVKDGELKVGDFFVAGNTFGKVRKLLDDKGKSLDKAPPSTPVQLLGFEEVPDMHSILYAVESIEKARNIAEKKKALEDNKREYKKHVRLEDFMKMMDQHQKKKLNIIIKAGTFGEIEALKTSILKLKNNEIDVEVVHAGVGAITSSDVMLASASDAVILGFRVKADVKAVKLAEQEGIQIKKYDIIFNLIDDIKKAILGMLEPETKAEDTGTGVIKDVFKIKKVGSIAGIQLLDGYVTKEGSVKIYRHGKLLKDVKIETLKHFKDEAKIVEAPKECGIKFLNYDDILEGDELEFYKYIEVERKLEFNTDKK